MKENVRNVCMIDVVDLYTFRHLNDPIMSIFSCVLSKHRVQCLWLSLLSKDVKSEKQMGSNAKLWIQMVIFLMLVVDFIWSCLEGNPRFAKLLSRC